MTQMIAQEELPPPCRLRQENCEKSECRFSLPPMRSVRRCFNEPKSATNFAIRCTMRSGGAAAPAADYGGDGDIDLRRGCRLDGN